MGILSVLLPVIFDCLYIGSVTLFTRREWCIAILIFFGTKFLIDRIWVLIEQKRKNRINFCREFVSYDLLKLEILFPFVVGIFFLEWGIVIGGIISIGIHLWNLEYRKKQRSQIRKTLRQNSFIISEE